MTKVQEEMYVKPAPILQFLRSQSSPVRPIQPLAPDTGLFKTKRNRSTSKSQVESCIMPNTSTQAQSGEYRKVGTVRLVVGPGYGAGGYVSREPSHAVHDN